MNWIKRVFKTSNIILILILFILLLLFIQPTIEKFEDSTTKPTPIENIGLGPFDYGLDQNIHLSKDTANTMDYMSGQNQRLKSGNYNSNIFSYMGS